MNRQIILLVVAFLGSFLATTSVFANNGTFILENTSDKSVPIFKITDIEASSPSFELYINNKPTPRNTLNNHTIAERYSTEQEILPPHSVKVSSFNAKVNTGGTHVWGEIWFSKYPVYIGRLLPLFYDGGLVHLDHNNKRIENTLDSLFASPKDLPNNIKDVDDKTPLTWAAMLGNLDLANVCLKNNIDPNIPDKTGTTPLLWAIKSGNYSVAQLLIKHGAKVNVQDKNGYTPLFVAIDQEKADMVKLLIENGAEINATTDPRIKLWVHIFLRRANYVILSQFTPLHLAVNKGNVAIIKLLIENGANMNAQDVGGTTPLALAEYTNRPDIGLLLGGDPEIIAAQKNRIEEAQRKASQFWSDSFNKTVHPNYHPVQKSSTDTPK